ncbi:hypothetical protein CD201_08325 [Hafnia alvei]|uniref:DUF2290 domain-containing protein n=1 Tax=Hafnia alvei TaxID=569 RepID=UPI000DAAE1F3|nr:DUF2290 domain-containing protein [Hafnia alvei]AWV44578.1 hypothetical protein CD201_08325 [Hafnia alvei]
MTAKLREVIDLFNYVELLEDSQLYVTEPTGFISECRQLSYPEMWEHYRKKHIYHILLSDQSMLYFREGSFSYLMTPYSIIELEEYFFSILQDDWEKMGDDERNSILRDSEYISEYKNYCSDERKSIPFTPIRCDYEPSQYNSITHPACHLHVGFENESRIPIKKKMTELAFSGFILATFYPRKWKKLVESVNFNSKYKKKMNQNVPSIPHSDIKKWCNENEETRFYLT